MHGFLALVVTVDNKIEHIAVLRFHRDELLAAGGRAADIVEQRQVPVRRQSGTAIQTAAQHTQQIFQRFRVQRERTFPGTSLAVTYRHVAGIDIADLFRQDDLQPVAVRADHLHGRSIGKLGEGGIIHSRTRADIQIAAARGDGAGLPRVIFAGTELNTVLGDGYRDLAACRSGKQIRDIPSRFLFSHGL